MWKSFKNRWISKFNSSIKTTDTGIADTLAAIEPLRTLAHLRARPSQDRISALIPSHDFPFLPQILISVHKNDVPRQITPDFPVKLSRPAEIFMISQVTH